MESIKDFYQLQINIYKILGIWKPATLPTVYNVYFWFVLFFGVLSLDLCLLIYLGIHISSLGEIIKVFFIFATALGVLAKYVVTKMRYASYMELFRSMRSVDYLPSNEHEVQIFNRSVRMSRKIRNGYALMSLLAANSVLFFTNDEDQFPLNIYFPISIDTTGRYYAVYCYQYIAVQLLCLTNIAFDSISTSFFIYLQGQLEMLAYRLEHIGSNVLSTEALKCDTLIGQQLKDCIRYYHRIVEITRLIEMVVSKPMSAQLCCSVMVLIANFYAIAVLSDGNEYTSIYKYFVYQCCMISQIFMLCLFANNVTLISSELSLMLYKSDWINWTKTNRRLMLLMMNQFTEPIRINSINRCYSFNLAAFTSIVNSSYSYFALLKNTRKP